MYFCRFFLLGNRLNMNGDFGPSRLSVKKRVFSISWWSFRTQRYSRTRAFWLICGDDTCKVSKKWKMTSGWCCAAGSHNNWEVWRGFKIAFSLCLWVCKRGRSRWNCPCYFLLLYNISFGKHYGFALNCVEITAPPTYRSAPGALNIGAHWGP